MTTNDTLNSPSPADDATDARIDAMARTAGSQLRRPAPERGFAQVKRARRTQQVTRAALGGTIAMAVVAMGAFAANRRTGDIAPVADVTISSTEPQASAPPNPTPTALIPTTAAALPPTTAAPVQPDSTVPPETAVGAPVAAGGAPSVVYVSGGENDTDQMVIDPITGEIIRTEPRDGAVADAARNTLDIPLPIRSVGAVSYDFTEAGYLESSGEAVGDPDRCLQTPVTVTSPAGSALPTSALRFEIGPTSQYIVTASTTCPEAGSAGPNLENRTTVPFETIIQVFDAAHPELPGRLLATQPAGNEVFNITFSGNGRFAAVLTYVGSNPRYFIYDLETGGGIGIAPNCTHSSNRSQVAWDQTAPWVGQSSIAFTASCPDGVKVEIADLMPGGETREISLPNTSADDLATVEVDQQHYTTSTDAWFTACIYTQGRCWIGNSNGELLEIPNVGVASFLPLSEYIQGD